MTLHWTRLLLPMLLAGDLSIHCIRRQIDLTRPRYCAVINEDLLEKVHVFQRRKCTGQFFPGQLNTSR